MRQKYSAALATAKQTTHTRLEHVNQTWGADELAVAQVLAERSQRLLVVPGREREAAVLLREDRKAHDPLVAYDRGGNVVDLVPGNLDEILRVALVVELDRLVSDHHVAVRVHPLEGRGGNRQVDAAVLRLGHGMEAPGSVVFGNAGGPHRATNATTMRPVPVGCLKNATIRR